MQDLQTPSLADLLIGRDTVTIQGKEVDIIEVDGLWSFDDPGLTILGRWPTKCGILACAKTLDEAVA